MDIKSLQALCDRFHEASILVIGDLILDHFVYGSVDRISPESPVPVLAQKREDYMLGGAGNSFANLCGLGAQVQMISLIGADDAGAHVKALLQDEGADLDLLVVDSARPTSIKTRFLAGHQQLLRSDFEVTHDIDDALAAQILQRFQEIAPTLDVVVLSDYGKGILRADLIADLIKAAKAHDVRVVTDPKGRDFSIYKGAYVITPNRKELSEAAQGCSTVSDDEVYQAARHLIDTCAIENVIATRSGDGMSVICGDEHVKPYHVRPQNSVEVFDVSGAGDTVIATLSASIAVGSSLDQAAELANIAGQIAVSKVGTSPIRLSELQDGAAEYSQSAASRMRSAPLLDDQGALEEVKRWRARGLKIGFTNGCFDIVHAGHVSYLDDARNHCDRLILALNCDQSVKILKGDSRPIHDEIARAHVMGALACVDMVILFGAQKAGEDNTARALLDLLQPDLYFKGGDYTLDQIPEAPTVQGYGGIVKVLNIVDGYSTSLAIEKSKIA